MRGEIVAGSLEEKLLYEMQVRFPVCRAPYEALGKRLGVKGGEAMETVARFRREGVIRRIGPVFDARANGLTSTLVALSVPRAKIENAARIINGYEGVTHNYLRDHTLNVWFTLTSRSRRDERAVLKTVRKLVSPERWLELPAKRIFKIGLVLRACPGAVRPCARRATGPRRYSLKRGNVPRRSPVTIFEKIPYDLPLTPAPFPRGSVHVVRYGIRSGKIRRFGALIDERKLGYRFTALVVWRVPASRRHATGKTFAAFDWVSHCYERRVGRGWPYSLYTVLHAMNVREGKECIRTMASAAGVEDYRVLRAIRRLKRTSLGFPSVRLNVPQ
jgi:DNA-binding Lrp family transcriptional regulator